MPKNKSTIRDMEMDFLQETDTEIIRNVHIPEWFIPDSFEAVPFGFDITLIIGQPREQSLVQQLINPETKMVQAVKFKKPPWTLEDALAWLQDNQRHFNSVDKLKKYASELKSIEGVEIFSAGVWNGDEYTLDDLEMIVKAFDENVNGFRPPLKLGHAQDQTLLQADGLPAAGWIGRVFIKGDKLLADFIDMPKKIFELIENKAYRKVSSEIFWNVKLGENFYSRALAGVALLGSDIPGCTNLNDILANFQLNSFNTIKSYNNDLESKIYNQGDKQMPKSEKEICLEKDLEIQAKKNEDLEAKIKQFSTDKEDQTKEIDELKKFKADQEAKLAEAEAKAKQAQVKEFITSLKAEKLCSPAMVEHVEQLVGDKKEYSIKEKSVTKQDLVKDMLKLFKQASEVNFEENSLEGEKNKLSSEDAIDARIKDYIKEHKVDYSTAYRAVINDMDVQLINDDGEE